MNHKNKEKEGQIVLTGCSSDGRIHAWGACGREFESRHPENAIKYEEEIDVINCLLY